MNRRKKMLLTLVAPALAPVLAPVLTAAAVAVAADLPEQVAAPDGPVMCCPA